MALSTVLGQSNLTPERIDRNVDVTQSFGTLKVPHRVSRAVNRQKLRAMLHQANVKFVRSIQMSESR
jgi:hypothetical protein